MAKWWVLGIAAAGCVLTIVFALRRDADVVAGISALGTLGALAVTLVKWLRKTIAPGTVPWSRVALVVGCSAAAPVAVLLLPGRLLGAATTPSVAPPPAPLVGSLASQSPTADPALARYCQIAVEFLGHAQRFSGKGWQGSLTKRDFDPIVDSLHDALASAPHEMQAPLTVLTSSYEAAQTDWSDDNMLANLGLAAGTILSPSTRTATEAVDTYENEYCF